MKVSKIKSDLEMNDKENIKLIEQALIDYKVGALIEAKDSLMIVVRRIEAWEIAESLMH